MPSVRNEGRGCSGENGCHSMSNAIPPRLCERVCDAGRTEMCAEDILKYTADLAKQYGESFMLLHPYMPGCGTRFQWYWGMNVLCPNCGRLYESKFEYLKSGKYDPK
jgi:hypothetical protein